MFGAGITLFFSLIWASAFYIYIKNRKVIRSGLLLGTLSFLFCVLWPLGYPGYVDYLYYNNLFPFLEEIVKFSAIYFYPFGGDYSDKEFYVMGASLGVCFSFLENFSISGSLALFLIINIFVTSLHVTTATISSYITFKSKYYGDKGWLFLIVIPILIHYFYNEVLVDYLINMFNL